MTKRLVLSYLAIATVAVVSLVLPFGRLVQGSADRPSRLWQALITVAVATVVASVALGLVLTRSMRHSINGLQQAAAALAAGNLGARATMDTNPREFRELASSFNDMAAELEQLVHAQQDFVADASHQLRTPLTALRFQLENIAASTQGSPRSWTEAALGRVHHLGQLIDNLLTLARLDAATTIERTSHSASDLVRSHAGVCAAIAEGAGCSIVFDLPDLGEPSNNDRIVVAPGHVEQIIDNYVANACRAAPDTELTVSVGVGEGDVTIHVIDCGPGMSDESRDRAFDRFWRAPANANVTGSGLGLPIVRRLAQTNGGTVGLSAALSEGIDAWACFPLERS